MKFYTWKDVDRQFLLKRTVWENTIISIDVYPTDITVYVKPDTQDKVIEILQSLFGSNYDPMTNKINLDIGNQELPVAIQEDDGISSNKKILPLFANVLYQPSSYPVQAPEDLVRPVIAFHSYKGGVGRTLSLLAFSKAWTTVMENKDSNRLLIVDSDIEAPGMTWLQQNALEDTFSYLDLLTLIQDNRNVDEIVSLACSKLRLSTITVETASRKVEHIFIPTYRYEEQLVDLYATPESIVNSKGKEYILATVLSKICEHLGLSAALVDLRAGISEYSSSLLLDPRVKKYFVTSTSTQSIRGTQFLLKYLLKGLPITEETVLPEIFLNMIPDALSEGEKDNILSELLQYYEQETFDGEAPRFTDNVVTELPFASELIHLTSVRQILQNLSGREIYLKMEELIRQNYKDDAISEEISANKENREVTLEKIHKLASSQLTAESNADFDVLMTASLQYLSRKYNDTIPTTVVMGAKGSGKTFLYRKMCEALEWTIFCSSIGEITDADATGLFLPVIASRNSQQFTKTFQSCINNMRKQLPGCSINNGIFLDNANKIEREKTQVSDWFSFWESLLVSSIYPQYSTLQKVNQELDAKNQKVIFLIDGLEDILTNISTDKNEQAAVQILCQDIIAQLIAKYPHIGIIVFLRRDMAQAAIEVNFQQFAQANGQAELKWSSSDALRLVVWLVSKAAPEFYKDIGRVDQASQNVIDDALVKLWGAKLGKASSNEAYSSRWILAALSDFNGQLQARDIIRFLNYASVPMKKATYYDRLIMPTEIRTAVSTCSKEKVDEVKQEYAALQPILEKFENLTEEHKTLPLLPEYAGLSSDEERSMIREGYLKRDGDKFYLPEIIRHALGFKYSKGARPKVLAFTLKS